MDMGWEWLLLELERKRCVTLRVSVGWSFAFHSSASLQADQTAEEPKLRILWSGLNLPESLISLTPLTGMFTHQR